MTEETRLNCSVNHNYREGYLQGRADAIEEFIEKHTLTNAFGNPFIFISDNEYEQLKAGDSNGILG